MRPRSLARSLARALLVAAAALALVEACTPATIESPTASCQIYADALCARLAACSTTVIALRYGTMSACTSLNQASCEVSLSVPSTGESASKREACAGAFPTWDCGDVLLFLNPPTACSPVTGPGANGTPCNENGQCSSTFCSIPNGQQCGTCQAIPAAGASCASAPCGPHDVCFGAEPTCLNHPTLNEQCQTPLTCAGGLACAGQSSTMMGTCLSGAATDAGASCAFTGVGCDPNQGVTCSASGVCKQLVIAQPGGACGTVDDQERSCAAGACVDGTCVGNLAAGAPCTVPGPVTPTGVPVCAATLRCISSSGDAGSGAGADGVCLPHTISDCSPPG